MNTIKNIDELKAQVAKERKAGKLTRGRAIRLHCLDCMGYHSPAVRTCPCKWCPLWEYRMGETTPTEGSNTKRRVAKSKSSTSTPAQKGVVKKPKAKG